MPVKPWEEAFRGDSFRRLRGKRLIAFGDSAYTNFSTMPVSFGYLQYEGALQKSGRVLCGLCNIAEAVPNLCQIDAAPLDVDGDLVFFRKPQLLADLALLFVLDVVQAQAVSLFLLDLLAVIQYARRVASMRSRQRSVSICCRRRCSSVISAAASPTLSPAPPPPGIPFRLGVVFSATSRMRWIFCFGLQPPQPYPGTAGTTPLLHGSPRRRSALAARFQVSMCGSLSPSSISHPIRSQTQNLVFSHQ